MAKDEAPPQAKGLFWNPGVGEMIEGTFVHFETLTDTNLKRKPGEVPKKRLGIRLNTEGGQRIVDLAWVLLEIFRPVRSTIKPGDRITVTFIGKKKTKEKRWVKEYAVTLNGTPLERPSPFGKPAAEADVSEVFGPGPASA